MPYSKITELPDPVKKLSDKKQRQWMAVFNSVYGETNDDAAAAKAAWAKTGGIAESRTIDLSHDISTLEEAMGMPASIDEAGSVIRNVVILTGNKVSGNKTKYLDSALNEAATRYEGAKMYLDHPLKEELAQRRGNRSVRDLAGTYQNVHREGDKIKGDLHVMEQHKSLVMGIAKARPHGTGLSIRDQGIVREDPETKTLLVEGFKKGANYSVDLVTEASVNEDLFESTTTTGGEDAMDFSKITIEDLTKNRPDLVESVAASANAKLAKEIQESKDKSESVLLLAQKLDMLLKAAFPAHLHEAVKKSIMSGSITLEEAKSIVDTWKETAAKLTVIPAGKGGGEPKVTGAGAERKVEEGSELPSDDQFAGAFASRF